MLSPIITVRITPAAQLPVCWIDTLRSQGHIVTPVRDRQELAWMIESSSRNSEISFQQSNFEYLTEKIKVPNGWHKRILDVLISMKVLQIIELDHAML
jgi:protein-L-isoaspartate O-methyltransferase